MYEGENMLSPFKVQLKGQEATTSLGFISLGLARHNSANKTKDYKKKGNNEAAKGPG